MVNIKDLIKQLDKVDKEKGKEKKEREEKVGYKTKKY